jgi:hypothetical protein
MDEQQACQWPQFRDIISRHRHEQQEQKELGREKLLGSEISGCYGGEYEDDSLLGYGEAESHSSL